MCMEPKYQLIWSEQISLTFSKAEPELQRQLDGNRGIIFPGMYLSIARILSAIASDIKVRIHKALQFFRIFEFFN